MNSGTMIKSHDYKELCDYSWNDKGGGDPPSGIVHVHGHKLRDFFLEAGREGNNNKYVVVHSIDDFSTCYQDRHEPWKDYLRYTRGQEFYEYLKSQNSYPIKLPLAHNPENCNGGDKYTVRTYQFTACTFNSIPDNILKIYSTNSQVDEIESLPFGLQNEEEVELIKKIRGENVKQGRINTKKLLYVNFYNDTAERKLLNDYFSISSPDWVTHYHGKSPRSKEDFLRDIAEHLFVLCPRGNGLDTWRLWQTLYLGSIPIVDHFEQEKDFGQLPILRFEDIRQLNMRALLDCRSAPQGCSYDIMDLEYWEKQFNNWREKLV